MRRLIVALLLATLWVLSSPATAYADPPGPTDYLSEITEIEPAAAGFLIEIVGGDSFILLTVDPGVRVDVVGYQGEPYLRFLANGNVEENQLAPSKFLNEDRYAAGGVPEEADPDAAPDWKTVSEDGSYAWHDHRTHWMNELSPPGRSPGDQIAEGVVPLLVDGQEVDVTVVSVWQQPPGAGPVVAGFTIGLLMTFGLIRRRGSFVLTVIGGLASAATFVGTVAYFSVPSETVPPWSLWAFPVTGLVLVILVAGAGERGGLFDRQRNVFLLVAALELVAWGVAHWGWLWPSILPTALPFWFDRFIASTVLVGAIGAAAAVVLAAAAPKPNSLSGFSSRGLPRAPRPRRPARRRFRS